MYLFKNAFRNIRKVKGRSILFGVIVLIIALAATLALSIRQAAETTKAEGLEELSITANITLDMDEIMGSNSSSGERPSKSDMQADMQDSALSLTELKKYAKLSSVKSFYYTGSLSMNASIDAVSTDSGEGGGFGGPGGGMQQADSGDFTITGYSSDEAMTQFSDGTATITEGSLFTEGTSDYTAVISSTLASYNDLSVGDTITLTNPDDSTKSVTVTIVGIYKTTTSTESGSDGMMTGTNANNIYMSYNAVKLIASDTGMTLNTQGTYTFADYSAYQKFEKQAHNAGLSSKYTVESRDVQNYERQLEPLENLSKYATIFLIILLVIGAAILIALTMFNIRGRKYEIGVLAAIGMSKKKIAAQFISEIAIVSIVAILLGGIIGGVSSVPVTNKLLSSSVATTTSQNFDRGGGPGGGGPQSESSSDQSTATNNSTDTSTSSDATSNSTDTEASAKSDRGGPMQDIITVTSAVNGTVILELIGVGLVLILISGGAAVATIVRYDPLTILTTRD